MIQQMLAIWSLVPLPFLNPAWTSGNSWFTYCWNLAWRILSITFSVWDECNCAVVWAFFGIGMKTDLLQSCGHCWVFQICWHIECSTFIASSFRIWNSSTGIPSPPLAFFVVMLLRPTWLQTLGSRTGKLSYHRGYLNHEDLFCIVLLCILAPFFNIFCLS